MNSKSETNILPIGPLMIEHRLIERMVALIERESAKMRDNHQVNIRLLDSAVDFFRFYADRCHHGKEEDILFKALKTKTLVATDKAMLEVLIAEHARARGLVGKLADGVEEICKRHGSEAAKSITAIIEDLVRLYEGHIRKEDKQFFIPVMQYFSKQELSKMLCEFREFDRTLIHEKYKSVISKFE
ncbi:MAG TPA: hemerythrin domain-containing protein [Candidatus Margulisiibacteriota bacterium]|nr:hemerythrin domain-containing protein [Candidatus Margulisiibacteriota bacterium]